MHRRVIVLALAILASCSRSATTSASSPAPVQSGATADASLVARARAIHERVLTIDTHKDIPDNYATPEADPKTMNSQVNLDKMKAGGYDMAFFAVYVGPGRAHRQRRRGRQSSAR